MKIIAAIAFASTLLASSAALAAAPNLHVKQTISIDASAGKVWKAVMSFDALNTWHPAVAADQIVEGTNDTVGAVRVLTLKGGGTIKEKLLAFDPAHRKFRYAIVEGVLPVSHYTASFAVKSVDPGKSSVTWSGRFKRKDLGPTPANNADDKTAVDTIQGVYQAGLDNLKKVVETAGK